MIETIYVSDEQLIKDVFGVEGIKEVSALYAANHKDLVAMKGIGLKTAKKIEMLKELAIRMNRSSAKEELIIGSPSVVADYMMPRLRFEKKEIMYMLVLNTKNKVIYESVISVGTVNGTVLSPREVFIEALNRGGVNILLVHNHPSGDPDPSQEDIQVTKRIKEAGEVIGITLLDHLVIGDGKYVSMKEFDYIN